MSETENKQTVQSEVEEKKPKRQKRQKTKQPTQTVEPKSATFPVEGFVNSWGFVRLSQKVTEAFGAQKGQKTPITIDPQEGALVIKKV